MTDCAAPHGKSAARGDCTHVTDVSPFAHCLLELDANSPYAFSSRCGIGSTALSDCCRLQVLYAFGNDQITTLQPFAQQLRELDAGGESSALSDAALADATGLVNLSMSLNNAITTVEPFGVSLRRLDATTSTIGHAGLVTATNLVYLSASCNGHIHNLTPFATSLIMLDASGDEFFGVLTSVHEDALRTATNLIWLDVSDNAGITTVPSCGRSLRHLVAGGKGCTLTNEGLSSATQLTTLNCEGNPYLTTIEPFRHTLEVLTTECEAQCLEKERAPNIRCIRGSFSKRSFAKLKRNGFIGRHLRDDTSTMHRNTVTYEL